MGPTKMIDPVRLYQLKGQVSPLKTVRNNAAVGANQVLVSPIPGKVIRVMGLLAQSSTSTLGVIRYLDSVTAAELSMIIQPPRDLGPFKLDIVECGYFEGATGSGINFSVDVAAVFTQVFYIEYTP